MYDSMMDRALGHSIEYEFVYALNEAHKQSSSLTTPNYIVYVGRTENMNV